MDFNDYLYMNGSSAGGPTQIGAGVSTYAVLGDYSQGALESTSSGTDLAIDGNGYFKVRKPNSQQMYYTRAGDFYFNTERQLQNPEGMILQGWKVDNKKSISFGTGTALKPSASESPYVGSGTPQDIVLDSWNLPPQQTTNISITNNLINDPVYDKSTSDTNPLTSLFDRWRGQSEPPIAKEAYATANTVDVYDEGGTMHKITTYMDKVNVPKYDNDGTLIYDITGLPAGYSVYEYLVTIPPSEDMRQYDGTYNPTTKTVTGARDFSDTEMAGVLMSGVMIFNGSGQLVNQTAYTYGATETPDANHQVGVDPLVKSSWQPTKFSTNGLPVFTANFTGQPLANSVSETMTATGGGTPFSQAQDYIIELDFGMVNATNAWSDATKTLEDLTVDATYTIAYEDLATMAGAERKDGATANNGTTFTNETQSDGYPSGVLSGYQIDTNGVVYGNYNNGESLALYQIALYDFRNYQGLYREGGNLFSATEESGEPRQGVPGDSGFGTTKAYNIEQSNVDMSREFVQMITTQRGFQANSKGITTVDTMLETIIGMKR